MKKHSQVWVKVNAPVDSGLAELVTVLNLIDGLQTIESCQGHREYGFIYFEYGNWRQLGWLIFERLFPFLWKIVGPDISISMSTCALNTPRAEMRFRVEAIGKITSALKKSIKRRRFQYSYGKYRIKPHN